jgi:hypothetical protein
MKIVHKEDSLEFSIVPEDHYEKDLVHSLNNDIKKERADLEIKIDLLVLGFLRKRIEGGDNSCPNPV